MSCRAASCPAQDLHPTVRMGRPASTTCSDSFEPPPAFIPVRPLCRRDGGPSSLVRWKQWCRLSWLLVDGSSQQGCVCGWHSTHSGGFGVGHSAPSLCALVQGQHLVSCPGCQREPLLAASTNMRWWSAHADSCPLSAISEQDPPGSAALPSNQVALGPIFLTCLFLFQV